MLAPELVLYDKAKEQFHKMFNIVIHLKIQRKKCFYMDFFVLRIYLTQLILIDNIHIQG